MIKMTTVSDEIKDAVVVADASTKAMLRATLIGTIPIIEFGALIAFTLLIVAVPAALLRRIKSA